MNINGLTKKEMEQRVRFHCHHGHNGFSHRLCFENRHNMKERVGFLDIEASNLRATFGIIYTYCIKELDGPIISRSISLDDLYTGVFDKNLLKQFIEDAKQFDRFVLHYGENGRFDIPFMRTRAVKWGLDFPKYKSMYVSDTYPILKNQFKLHSNRLETACTFFDIPSKQHKLNPDVWLDMITGNKKRMKKALDYIQTHNEEDVISTEKLWKKISGYVNLGKKSI